MRPDFNVLIIAIVLSLFSAASAQNETAVQPSAINPAEPNAAISFPYTAVITEDNINIRSGAGTNYYVCGQLDKGDTVKVVTHKHSWSQIVPPKGGFSWISKQYVIPDPQDTGMGIVTGDNIRVYAGSDFLKPIHSTTVQTKLDKGQRVKLFGEPLDDYYKIVSPDGAYLWISTEFTRPVSEARDIIEKTYDANEPDFPAVEPGLSPTYIPAESKWLTKYKDIEERIQQQRQLPIEQQNYAEIKEQLTQIAQSKEAGKAARYAEFTLKQVARYELAIAVSQDMKAQDTELLNKQQKINNELSKKLEKIVDYGQFAAIGIIQTSNIYSSQIGAKLYTITDQAGQIVCYAVPTGLLGAEQVQDFIGKKIGLVGQIEPHQQTSKALVKFSKIIELN
ncbi:MAG: SH3 domain-containing protein [Phycisphaerae bacterium]|nr:SH3 domain-containing protein [Phycisphaerae bacterium]